MLHLKKEDKVLYTFKNEIGTYMGTVPRLDKETGEYRYLITFSAAKSLWISESQLQGPLNFNDPITLMENGVYGGITDLRRIIFHQRLSGTLTNLMYSMNNASTQYMPHQFKPVLKFLESPAEHLLIADEVGLGKTIEACYIWNELVVRRNARRLLVVAPAILTEKWHADLSRFFDIPAEIVNVDELTKRIQMAIDKPGRTSFSLVTSLEGIRYASTWKEKDKSEANKGKRERLNELLDSHAQEDLFDLVIIDEAHYLRNRGTASYQTGERLRDASAAMVLLSATPIQNASEDLFNLLSLMAPEDFPDLRAFWQLNKENEEVVKLATDIDHKASSEQLETDFQNIEKTDFYGGDPDIENLHAHIDDIMLDKDLNPSECKTNHAMQERLLAAFNRRIKAVSLLQEKYFYSNWVTRTRKRDVDENKRVRQAYTVQFSLTPYEKDVYDRVSTLLKRQIKESTDKIGMFRLMARQRQMASSMPAAFEAWRDNKAMQDLLYEDLGYIPDEEEGNGKEEPSVISLSDVDNDYLRRNDSKYQALLETLRKLLGYNRREKILLFSYFRQTISYLNSRLNQDGIRTVMIRGGMGQEKYDTIRLFQDDPEINVLISSEVGSEGIDLQFASIEINYDLPWNPMRLEQRIGRIDRIGQMAEKIQIYNVSCRNTIEDRILSRLYQKIRIFQNSIGDLEDILGDTVEKLAETMFDPHLTPEEIEKQADDQINALVKKRLANEELEKKADELVAYKDYILGEIKDAHETRRFITPRELAFTVKDFLGNRYPGTDFSDGPVPSSLFVALSPQANSQLHEFIVENNYPVSETNLGFSSNEVLCVFDKKQIRKLLALKRKPLWESVDIAHPLIRWIVSTLEQQMYDTLANTAIRLVNTTKTDLDAGDYLFYIQRWEFDGAKKINELHYFMANIHPGTEEGENNGIKLIEEQVAEKTIQQTLLYGENLGNVALERDSLKEAALITLQWVLDLGWDSYTQFSHQSEQNNLVSINRQLTYLQKTAERKIQTLTQTIDSLKEELKKAVENGREESERKGLQNVIHMDEAKREVIRNEWESRKMDLEAKKTKKSAMQEVAVGILRVEEGV